MGYEPNLSLGYEYRLRLAYRVHPYSHTYGAYLDILVYVLSHTISFAWRSNSPNPSDSIMVVAPSAVPAS